MQEITPDRAAAVVKGSEFNSENIDSHTYIQDNNLTENDVHTYIHTYVTKNNNNNNNNVSSKVLRSWKVDVSFANSLKLYAVQSGKDASVIVELAVSEYMVNHPVTSQPTYNVVVENTVIKQPEVKAEKLTCQIGDCKKPAVEVMIYQPKGAVADERRVCNACKNRLAQLPQWSFKK